MKLEDKLTSFGNGLMHESFEALSFFNNLANSPLAEELLPYYKVLASVMNMVEAHLGQAIYCLFEDKLCDIDRSTVLYREFRNIFDKLKEPKIDYCIQ